MSEQVDIFVIVEGATEQQFIKQVLAPYLGAKSIFMTPIIASKKGEKGGDIKFERMKIDFRAQLKQRSDTYLTTFIDFYGIKEWPEYEQMRQQSTHTAKAEKFCDVTQQKVEELFAEQRADRRFIPYVNMHEFEALLFSEPGILARYLRVDASKTNEVVSICGEPEKINDSPNTAPSKRLKALCPGYGKIAMGIAIAKEIGVEAMRQKCPLFNGWLTKIEELRVGA